MPKHRSKGRRDNGTHTIRVNVSIPAPLVARLRALPERLNVSLICSTALEFEVEKAETWFEFLTLTAGPR